MSIESELARLPTWTGDPAPTAAAPAPAASDPDQGLRVSDDLLAGIPLADSGGGGGGGAFIRALGRALPETAGTMAGAGLGASIGSFGGPLDWLTVPGGAIVGGLLGGYGVGRGVEAAKPYFPETTTALGQDPEQIASDVRDHYLASTLGNITAQAMAMRPSISALTRLGAPLSENVARIAGGAGLGGVLGGGIQYGQNVAMGAENPWEGVPLAAGLGVGLNKSYGPLGKGMENVGASLLSPFARPRPGNPLYRPPPVDPNAPPPPPVHPSMDPNLAIDPNDPRNAPLTGNPFLPGAPGRVDPNAPRGPNEKLIDPNAPRVDPNAPVPQYRPSEPRIDPNVPRVDPNAPQVDPNAPRVDPNAPQVASSAAILGPYARGNARVGGPSGVEGVDPMFAQRIQQMVAAMPPELQARFGIDSGHRDAARQAQVNPGVEHSHHTMGLAVDISRDYDVINWINQHGHDFGIGFPLNADPKEDNHMEPLDANGHRIAGAEHTLASGATGSAEAALGQVAQGGGAGAVETPTELSPELAAAGGLAAAEQPPGTPAAVDHAAAAADTPLERAMAEITALQAGAPVTMPRIAQAAGASTRAEVTQIRDALQQRGLIVPQNGRYRRGDTINAAEPLAPTDAQAETLPQQVKSPVAAPTEPAMQTITALAPGGTAPPAAHMPDLMREQAALPQGYQIGHEEGGYHLTDPNGTRLLENETHPMGMADAANVHNDAVNAEAAKLPTPPLPEAPAAPAPAAAEAPAVPAVPAAAAAQLPEGYRLQPTETGRLQLLRPDGSWIAEGGSDPQSIARFVDHATRDAALPQRQPSAETPRATAEQPPETAAEPRATAEQPAAAVAHPDLAEEQSGLPPGYAIEHNQEANTYHLRDPNGNELEALPEPGGMADVARMHADAMGDSRYSRPLPVNEEGLTPEHVALRGELHRLLKQIAPSLRLKTARDLMVAGEPIHGRFDPAGTHKNFLEHLAQVALSSPNPIAELHHEIVHFFRAAGMFTKGEWAALTKHADRWRAKYKIDERYPGETLGYRREEAIADAAGRWRRGEEQVPPGIRRVFQKMQDFLERVGNFLKGRGYQSASDVFAKMHSGEIGRRAEGSGLPPEVEGTRFAITPTDEPELDRVLPEKDRRVGQFVMGRGTVPTDTATWSARDLAAGGEGKRGIDQNYVTKSFRNAVRFVVTSAKPEERAEVRAQVKAFLESDAGKNFFPKDINFWDDALKLPDRARFWYEISAEAFKHAARSFSPAEMASRLKQFFDVVAATSAQANPFDNLRRTLGIMAEHRQGIPVKTDVTDTTAVRNALGPNDLSGNKTGAFSRTFSHLLGIVRKTPLSVNDRQVASTFGISGEDISNNQWLHKALSKFYQDMRDKLNQNLRPGENPYETWQLQALAWVHERAQSNAAKGKVENYDDYDLVMKRLDRILTDAGVDTSQGLLSDKVLMDPRVPNILSGTREQFVGARQATLEATTALTPEGRAAKAMLPRLAGIDAPWARQFEQAYVDIQRRAMNAIATRVGGGQSAIEKLFSAVSGRKIGVTRIDTEGYGTFEGELSPNMRIPMAGRYTPRKGETGLFDFEDPSMQPAREAVLAAFGKYGDQAASAASKFDVVPHGDPNARTQILFIPGTTKGEHVDAIERFGHDVGVPLNVHETPNGTVVELNIGGFEDNAPTTAQVQAAADRHFPNTENGIVASDYKSDYLTHSDYDEKIRAFWDQANANPPNVAERVGRSGTAAPKRELWDEAIQTLTAASRRRDSDNESWERRAGKRIDKHERDNSAASSAAGSAESADALRSGGTRFSRPDLTPEERASGAPHPHDSGIRPAVHFVGFRDPQRYANAERAFGPPDYVHHVWDNRAQGEIAPGDKLVFAKDQPDAPSPYSYDDSNQPNDPAAQERLGRTPETRFSRPHRGVESDQEYADYARLVNQGDMRTIKQKAQDLWHQQRQNFGARFKQGFVDDTMGRENFERELNGGRMLDPKLSPTEEARRARYVSSMVQVALGVKGPRGEIVGAPLRFSPAKGTFEPIPGAKPLMASAEPIWTKGLQVKTGLYLMARRAQDLMRQGRENLVKQSDLQYLKFAQQHPEIAQFAKEWDAFNEHLLDFSEWGGTLSAEQRAKFGKNYVPFYRIDENGDPIQSGSQGAGQHMRSGFKKLTGGEAQVHDLWDNMFHNTEMIMGRAIRNHANKSLIEMGSGVGGVTPLSKTARDELRTPAGQTRLRNHGLDPVAEADRADAMGKDLFAMQQSKDKRLISFMANGEPQYYHIDNPLLMRSLSAFGPQAVQQWLKIAGMPAHLLSRGVTLMPDYMLRNFTRDTVQSQALTPSLKIPGQGVFKGFVDAYRNSPDMLAMMAAGGGGGHGMFYGQKISPLRARLEAEMPQSLKDRILNTPKKLLEAYENIGKAGEQANRLAIFNSLKGKSVALAAKEARDILPFAQRGDSQIMQALITMVPFLNARVQGLNRMYRGAKENPMSLALRGGLLTAATAALWYHNKDDERYKQLPDYARQNYLHLMGPGFHYMLPQPFEHGAIFSTIPEIMMNYMSNGSSKEAFNAAMAMVENQLNFNPIPQFAKPALDLYANKNSFTGAPIVTPGEEGLEAGLQVSPQTSATIAALGHQLGVSPAKLDYAIKGYTGGLGIYALAAADGLGEKAGLLPPTPSGRVDQLPIVSSFYRQGPERANRDINDFYDLSNSVKALHKSIELLSTQGLGKEAGELALRDPMRTGLYSSVSSMDQGFAGITKSEKAIKAAVANRTMTPEAGREILDKLTVARNTIGATGARKLNRLGEGLPLQ